jgi:branched-subunit amino acid aminotransferase/4-amino-4-deoxychorismate lyase
MHEYVSFNQEILRAEDARIFAASSAALYGRGIFTTIAIYDTKPFLWEKHWLRLNENAKKLEIDLSEYAEETVWRALSKIIGINNLTNARARLTFFDETPGGIWSFRGARKTSLLIMTAQQREISGNFRLTVSPFRINSASPIANVKSCNYLEKTLALEEAKKRGYDEAVQMNERDEIVSACMANIFWTKDEKLFTPPLATGCLAGTTRALLMEQSNCIEIKAKLESLQKADAIFLTSAGIGVVQIGEFEKKTFGRKSDDIARIFEKAINEKTRSGTKTN